MVKHTGKQSIIESLSINCIGYYQHSSPEPYGKRNPARMFWVNHPIPPSPVLRQQIKSLPVRQEIRTVHAQRNVGKSREQAGRFVGQACHWAVFGQLHGAHHPLISGVEFRNYRIMKLLRLVGIKQGKERGEKEGDDGGDDEEEEEQEQQKQQ